MKKENTIMVELDLPLIFDGKNIQKLSFDLEHINRGWNALKGDYNYKYRSHYSSSDIVHFFEHFALYPIEWNEEQNGNKFTIELKGKLFTRYVATFFDDIYVRRKTIVIDIEKTNISEGIIVTIY